MCFFIHMNLKFTEIDLMNWFCWFFFIFLKRLFYTSFPQLGWSFYDSVENQWFFFSTVILLVFFFSCFLLLLDIEELGAFVSLQKGGGTCWKPKFPDAEWTPPSHPSQTHTHTDAHHMSRHSPLVPCTVFWRCSLPVLCHFWEADRCGIMEQMSSPVRFRSNKKGRWAARKHSGVTADEWSLLVVV